MWHSLASFTRLAKSCAKLIYHFRVHLNPLEAPEHPAYFAYVIKQLDEDGDGVISPDEMNNALV